MCGTRRGDGPVCRGHETVLAFRLGGQNPGVLAQPASLAGYDQSVRFGRNSRQPARHGDVTVVAADEKTPQHHRPRLQAVARKGRRGGQCDLFLPDEGVWPGPNLLRQPVASRLREPRAEDRGRRRVGERGFDYQAVETVQDVGTCRGVAAPPCRHAVQTQVLSQQHLGQPGQEGRQTCVFEYAAAERIGDRHAPVPHRLKQAGDAQHRLGLQFQRVATDVVHPPQHDADGLQSADRLEPHTALTDCDVIGLHQRIIQIMGQIGVLEIRFVGRTGSQDDGSAPGRGQAGGKPRAQCTEKQDDAVDLGVAVQAGQHPRHHDAVLQGVTGPRRCLGAVAQHAHRPIRAADQVRGV